MPSLDHQLKMTNLEIINEINVNMAHPLYTVHTYDDGANIQTSKLLHFSFINFSVTDISPRKKIFFLTLQVIKHKRAKEYEVNLKSVICFKSFLITLSRHVHSTALSHTEKINKSPVV